MKISALQENSIQNHYHSAKHEICFIKIFFVTKPEPLHRGTCLIYFHLERTSFKKITYPWLSAISTSLESGF